MMDLTTWKKALCLKNLWNLSKKAERLWVKWIHCYYFKISDAMNFQQTKNCSWVLKSVLKSRSLANITNLWSITNVNYNFPTKEIYKKLRDEDTNVPWRKLFFKKFARPRARFITWLACHEALNTKDRLLKMGITNDLKCVFCSQKETQYHIFFGCNFSVAVWEDVLKWMKVIHKPAEWDKERQ